ncbi:MAG: hypothetical protein JOZ39_05840, partial [Chloroflexi bacterium]|nr:hypothetical protein [Chloroflexota bacterium]
MPTTTRFSINYQTGSQRIPLYQKALAFMDRDVQMHAVANQALAGIDDPRTQLQTLLTWTHANIRPTPLGFPIVDDHPYHIVVRGYGPADQADDVFSILAAYKGIPATLIFCHDNAGDAQYAYAAAELDGAWRLFDVREGYALKNTRGDWATVDELRANPNLAAGLPVPAESHGNDVPTLIRYLDPIPEHLRPEDQMPLSRLAFELRRRLPA